MRSVKEHETILPAPMSSTLIETFAFYLLFGTLALAEVPAAFVLAPPETDPVIRRVAFRFGAQALLAILIEVDYHRCSPPPFPGPPIHVPALLNVIELVPQTKRSRASLPGAEDSSSSI